MTKKGSDQVKQPMESVASYQYHGDPIQNSRAGAGDF